MKANATLEDYQKREVFLIRYIESQIKKLEGNYAKYGANESYVRAKPYKDILFKLTKE